MEPSKKGELGHCTIYADPGIPLEANAIERIYILLSEVEARRLDVATGDRVEVKRNDCSIYARVEIENTLMPEAHALFLSFDQAMEEKIANFLNASITDIGLPTL